jgi:hypothetical protein
MVDEGISASGRLRMDKARKEGAPSTPERPRASIDGSSSSPWGIPASIDGPVPPGGASTGGEERATFPPRAPIPRPQSRRGGDPRLAWLAGSRYARTSATRPFRPSSRWQ